VGPTIELDDRPFRKEDLPALGLDAGGTYETVVLVDMDDALLLKPLGLHVTSCGLFVTIYLPSGAFGKTGPADRMFISIPSYRDVWLFTGSLSDTPVADAVDHPFERSVYARLPDLPGLLVEVAAVEEGTITDERGEVEVRHLILKPLQSLVPAAGWTPICRAHAQLVEAAIALTRDDREGAARLLEKAQGTAPYSLREAIGSMENLI